MLDRELVRRGQVAPCGRSAEPERAVHVDLAFAGRPQVHRDPDLAELARRERPRCDTREVKLTRVAALICVAVVASGCGSSSEEEVGAAPTSTTTAVSSAPAVTVPSTTTVAPTTTTPPAPTTTVQPAPPPLMFSAGMVQARGVSKENKGGQSNVRFVAGSTNADEIEQLALECVREFAKQTKAAFCYAYGTQADYDVTEADWTPEFDESEYGGSRPCWVAYAGQALADSSPSVGVPPDSVSYQVSECPGGVQFP